ncbi:hypothetical protein HPP92_010020 [Vanilla planifolia]|uniref:Uncharacterized protein n=1 Tax=Vanilla planifolia TaxID=51239 RepID=A0A835R399_VANPL|nr:hypothetical protein HPP92_010020 [Vanilla planifolia]
MVRHQLPPAVKEANTGCRLRANPPSRRRQRRSERLSAAGIEGDSKIPFPRGQVPQDSSKGVFGI